VKAALTYANQRVEVASEARRRLQTQEFTDRLVSSLGHRTWLLLLDRQPTAVLADADAALKLDPKQDWIAVNEAHAYLFLGRFDDAEKIYLANKDHPGSNLKTVRDDILADFSLFERSNMAPPGLERMRHILTQ